MGIGRPFYWGSDPTPDHCPPLYLFTTAGVLTCSIDIGQQEKNNNSLSMIVELYTTVEMELICKIVCCEITVVGKSAVLKTFYFKLRSKCSLQAFKVW